MTFPTGEIDPNTVRPGWVALLIVLALAGATVLLWRNMGKQLKKIDFDPPAGATGPRESGDQEGRSGAAPVETTAGTANHEAEPGDPATKPRGTTRPPS